MNCIPSTEETYMWRNNCTKMDFMWVYGLKIKKVENILVSLFCKVGVGPWGYVPSLQHNKGLHALITTEQLWTFQERPCVLVEIFSSNHTFVLSYLPVIFPYSNSILARNFTPIVYRYTANQKIRSLRFPRHSFTLLINKHLDFIHPLALKINTYHTAVKGGYVSRVQLSVLWPHF